MMKLVVQVLAIAAIFYFLKAQDQRTRRAHERAGNAIHLISRPIASTAHLWISIAFPVFIATTSIMDLPNAVGATVVAKLLVVIWAAIIVISVIRSACRGERIVDAILAENGVLVVAGAQAENELVSWAAITRWTWTHAPNLQLNLFDGRAVFSIPVEESTRIDVERILQTKTRQVV